MCYDVFELPMKMLNLVNWNWNFI